MAINADLRTWEYPAHPSDGDRVLVVTARPGFDESIHAPRITWLHLLSGALCSYRVIIAFPGGQVILDDPRPFMDYPGIRRSVRPRRDSEGSDDSDGDSDNGATTTFRDAANRTITRVKGSVMQTIRISEPLRAFSPPAHLDELLAEYVFRPVRASEPREKPEREPRPRGTAAQPTPRGAPREKKLCFMSFLRDLKGAFTLLWFRPSDVRLLAFPLTDDLAIIHLADKISKQQLETMASLASRCSQLCRPMRPYTKAMYDAIGSYSTRHWMWQCGELSSFSVASILATSAAP
ncbi:hypothetical protein B484DRAFT_395896 [Ochromonadaceae sp. CCMP2298]|nr:hypothetical protein B484DRAFT_395896 [Ochromonadaceae sp. CCMP2298]